MIVVATPPPKWKGVCGDMVFVSDGCWLSRQIDLDHVLLQQVFSRTKSFVNTRDHVPPIFHLMGGTITEAEITKVDDWPS